MGWYCAVQATLHVPYTCTSTNYFGKRISGDLCRSPISDDRGLAEFDCSACCNVAVDWQSISATRISSDLGHPVPELSECAYHAAYGHGMGSNIYIMVHRILL